MTTLTELQSLKRSELQALCKTHELRANGKTGILIQLLQKHYAATTATRKITTTKRSKVVLTPSPREEEDEFMIGATIGAAIIAEEPEGIERNSRKKGKGVVTVTPGREIREAGLALHSAVAESTTLNDLVALVHTLRSELETTKAAFVDISQQLAGLPRPVVAPVIDIEALQDEIDARVEERLRAFEEEQGWPLLRLGSELKASIRDAERRADKGLGEMRGELCEGDTLTLARIAEARKETTEEINSRLRAFESKYEPLLNQPFIQSTTTPLLPPHRQVLAPPPAESPATLDAPPTPSLTSLSSTPSSPLPEDQLPAPSSVAGQTSSIVGSSSPAKVVGSSSPAKDSTRRSPRKVVGGGEYAGGRDLVGRASGGREMTPRVAGREGVEKVLASGKRARENEPAPAQAAATSFWGMGPTRNEDVIIATPEGEGRERKRTKVADSPSSEGDSHIAPTTLRSQVRDSTVRTKTGNESTTSKSTSNPSFFAPSFARPVHSTTPGSAGRKSMPISELPFPLVSPFRGKIVNSPVKSIAVRTAVFGDSSNTTTTNTAAPKSTFSFSAPLAPPRSIARLPPSRIVSAPVPTAQETPAAFKTMFGTEKSVTRFGDEVIDSPLGGAGTPVGYGSSYAGGAMGTGRTDGERFVAWNGFGGI